jgi:hypothetical protein
MLKKNTTTTAISKSNGATLFFMNTESPFLIILTIQIILLAASAAADFAILSPPQNGAGKSVDKWQSFMSLGIFVERIAYPKKHVKLK